MAIHPVGEFLGALEAIPRQTYPEALVPVAGRHIPGVAAFPAGRGLYAPCGWDHRDAPPFPFGGVMFVGHHLDAEDVYVERLRQGAANGDPCPGARRMRFWSRLYSLLESARVPRHEIFVTNAYPALLRGAVPTGSVRSTPEWEAACEGFLRLQMDVMRPRVVVAMGRPAQRFVARMLGVSWGEVPGVASTQRADTAAALAIRHPSAAQSREMSARTASLLGQTYRAGAA